MESLQLEGLRLLIVEDEFLIAMDMEQLCRDHGAADAVVIGTAADLGAAPAGLADFDAAILDVMVEGQPTLDFARSLAERGIPFVFATGYSDCGDVFAAFPGVRVVGKPYAGDDIVEAVVAALAAAGGAGAAG